MNDWRKNMNNIKIVNNLGKDVKVEVNNGEITIAWIKGDRKLSNLKAGDVLRTVMKQNT